MEEVYITLDNPGTNVPEEHNGESSGMVYKYLTKSGCIDLFAIIFMSAQ